MLEMPVIDRENVSDVGCVALFAIVMLWCSLTMLSLLSKQKSAAGAPNVKLFALLGL